MESSWSKMVSIEIDGSLGLGLVQLEYVGKNGQLLGFTEGGELVSYGPTTKQTRGLGLCEFWCSWFIGAYRLQRGSDFVGQTEWR